MKSNHGFTTNKSYTNYDIFSKTAVIQLIVGTPKKN